MAQFQNNFVQDLTQNIKIRQCGTIVFNNDNLSNVVSVALYSGEEVYTGGGTVVGAVVCPDGATVALDGTLSGNVASITLTGDCFALQGQIGVSIQIVNGDTRTTVLKAIYNVDISSTDTIVDPGSRITLSLAEIEAELDEIPTILANAQTAVDGIEAQKDTMIASIASVAGQGTDTTLTQSGVAADAKTTGDQVRDLKSAIDTFARINYDTVSGYVNAWGDISADSDASNGTLTTENILCEPGDIIKFYINFSTEKTEWIAYALYGSNGGFISRTVLYNMVSGTSFAEAVTIPDNAHYIAISYRTFNESSAYIGLCSPISGIVSNIDKTISIYANDAEVTVTAPTRLDTGIQVAQGQKFKITVSNFTDGGIYLYVGSNTDVRHYIAGNEEYVFTPASSGNIIFNPDGGSANIRIHFVTVYDSKEDSSNKISAFTENPTNTQYPSAKLVYDTISVYANDAVFSVSSRVDTGIFVKTGQKFKITVSNFEGSGIYVYVGSNTDVRHYISGNEEYTFTPVSSGNIIFNPDGGTAVIRVHLVSIYDNNGATVYTVGTGGDYATFTEMLISLENDASEKIVYVNPGVYDIFDEMGGAEYLASLADTASSLNWRDVCHVVPPNTTIIGIGEVQLNWLPDASDVPNNAVKVLFSPLNTSGNCHIENITINAKNCRYALHDETSNKAQYYGAKHEYINCKIYAEGTNAIGSGHCRNQSLIFKNCVLESSTGNSVFMHDWPSPANGKSNIVFENCVVTGGIMLNSCDTVGRLDSVKLFNCFITNGNIHLIADDQTNSYLQGYTIEAIGTTQLNFTHNSNVAVSKAPVEYNVQSR